MKIFTPHVMALVHENHGNIRLANILGVYHI
jgi:hypothetical protein